MFNWICIYIYLRHTHFWQMWCNYWNFEQLDTDAENIFYSTVVASESVLVHDLTISITNIWTEIFLCRAKIYDNLVKSTDFYVFITHYSDALWHHLIWKSSCFYRQQTKLWKGNVFTPVCQSFCSQGGGCLPQCLLGYTPFPLGRHPPPPLQTATAADGAHPTGMHTCSKLCDCFLANFVKYSL